MEAPKSSSIWNRTRPAISVSGKPKDNWQKFSAICALVTALAVALIGGMFNAQQRRQEAYQAAQEVATKEHEARVLELQTVAQFMPYLTSKDENAKQVAITAIKALSNTRLAIELAALNR